MVIGMKLSVPKQNLMMDQLKLLTFLITVVSAKVRVIEDDYYEDDDLDTSSVIKGLLYPSQYDDDSKYF